MSGSSFTLLAENVKNFASLATYDIQGHGFNNKDENFVNFTLESLVSEAGDVLIHLSK